MRRTSLFIIVFVLVFALAVPAAGDAAEPEKALPPHAACAAPAGDYVEAALLERPTAIVAGVGTVSQKVTTKSPAAQAFYD
ncbi:MAG: hypothetical protein ABI610_14260, partial [Acidobacteriota bacterium]